MSKRPQRPLLNPSTWAGLSPYGLGQQKPNHIAEMLQVVWDNRDNLPYAWRILNRGVCDGCALGTTGMKDFTLEGIHLCTIRLQLLRLNTMRALNPALLGDVELLRRHSSKALRDMGRLPHPMVRYKGDIGFRRIGWDEAMALAAERIKTAPLRRQAYFVTSRGLLNETYYVIQKAVRALGTNHVDNSARICHAPSTVALKAALGVTASTCSYKDWIGSDLLVFIGSDVPNNQPVTTKYIYNAKLAGTKVIVINPFIEPGLKRYWVPSVPESFMFGTRIADRFFQIHTGGDMAFLNGVLKTLIANGQINESFISDHTVGFDAVKSELEGQSMDDLERWSGSTAVEMAECARYFAEARSAVLIWSMGITQHTFGVDNVKAITNLALARGFVGRPHCGVMPIRGHSGVQGGSEMGAAPWTFPGGVPIGQESAAHFSRLWGFDVPDWKGWTATEMLDQAGHGNVDVLWSIGGNFLETLPEPSRVEEALMKVPFRVFQDIVVTSQMLIDPSDTVLLLPATTRYEQPGGGTETSTERQVIYSPEISGPRIEEARPEWHVFQDLVRRVRPELKFGFLDAQSIRQDIAQAAPMYDGIQHLYRQGDHFQYGGPLLCAEGKFDTPDGKAHFFPLRPPDSSIPEGFFRMSTRRGKQFNSMVQKTRDPLTGARREDVLMNADDARSLGLKNGSRIVVQSDMGVFEGRCKIVPIRPRNVQMHWPEANVLLQGGRYEPQCHIPDYNTLVTIRPLEP